MIAHDIVAAGLVNLSRDCVADPERAADNCGNMQIHAVGFLGVGNLNFQIRPGNSAGVANLSAALAIEGSFVEDEGKVAFADLISSAGTLLVLNDNCQHLRLFGGFV